jgi:hypothetical protein
MKASSSIIAGLVLILLTLSSIFAISTLEARIIRDLRIEADLHQLSLEQRRIQSTLVMDERNGYVVVRGISPGEVKYLVLVSDNGSPSIYGPRSLQGSEGEVFIPAQYLLSSDKAFIVLRNNVVVDLRYVAMKEQASDIVSLSPSIFTLLLAKGLNTSDLYKLLEEPIHMSEPIGVSTSLPIKVSIKSENTSYIIETTSRDCPLGLVRVLYWGARTDYLVNVTLGDRVLYTDKGTIQFTYTGSGTRSAYKSFPLINGNATLPGLNESVVLSLSLESFMELIASSPSPMDYCSSAFYYTQPSVGFNAKLTITLSLSNNKTGISIIPEVMDAWVRKPSYYSETRSLYGYYAKSDSIYIYMKSNVIYAFYSSIYGTSVGGGEISVYYPKIRFSYVVIN